MAKDVVIRTEGLGKKYIISHQAERDRYTALRDVIWRTVRGWGRSACGLMMDFFLIPSSPGTPDFAIACYLFSPTPTPRHPLASRLLFSVFSKTYEPLTTYSAINYFPL